MIIISSGSKVALNCLQLTNVYLSICDWPLSVSHNMRGESQVTCMT